MDITIKGIPTQAIADRVMGVAKNLVDSHIDAEARTISKEVEDKIKTDKDTWRVDNQLPKEFEADKE